MFVKYDRLFVKCDRVNSKLLFCRKDPCEKESSLPSRCARLAHLIH